MLCTPAQPYSVRLNEDRIPRFCCEDVLLRPGTARLTADDSVLELRLTISEQGYGGYSTWLSGDLECHDAFSLSFPRAVPDDFSFGLACVNNPNQNYHKQHGKYV